MNSDLMVLPATRPEDIRLIRIPDDLEEREAYRYVTGLIAKVEEDSEYSWDDIQDLLEERGFETVNFVLGPSLDKG
ncbi:MAG: hypothetical protein OEM07_07360 [Gammaproteobacteria bacterium]|nr:hypothetical protein [Gammaproteobacteria bacterium]